MSARGGTSLDSRALGPDLARGFMLLFIALANSHYFLSSTAYFGGFPADLGPLDAVVAWAISTFVDGRAFPMFGLLFELGVAATALLAVATWLLTVLLADWLRRTGRRGPFEVLVRRVTYGPSGVWVRMLRQTPYAAR